MVFFRFPFSVELFDIPEITRCPGTRCFCLALVFASMQYEPVIFRLCWRHTVPKLTQDGNTMTKIFTFGSDREISYSKSHLRVAFVTPSWKLRVLFECNRVTSVDIVMTSADDWLISKFGTNFARNSKFHIRMTILCQLRDSVAPALQ